MDVDLPQAYLQLPSPIPPSPPLPPLPPLPPPSPPRVTASGRPARNYHLPARYQDILPEPPLPATETEPEPTLVWRVLLIVRNHFQTATNNFGLWRDYLYCPSYDPNAFVSPEDLYRTQNTSCIAAATLSNAAPTPAAASSHANQSISMIHEWQNTGSSSKSDQELNRLVKEVLLHPEFCLNDLSRFNAQQENRHADEADKQSPHLDSFQESSIKIEVPSGDKDVPSRIFQVPGLMHRKLTAIIRAAFAEPLSENFHLSPYRLYHTSPTLAQPERVFSEVYDSNMFIEEHDKVQRAPLPPNDPDCKREKIIAALMFWSDSTHLANFGTAKLWPIYLLFGNLSKYIRAQPNSGATHHLAYIPTIPDFILAEIASFHAKWGTQKKDILAHCRRELMHAVWRFLLDDEFIHAYTYGIVIQCHDGIQRRIYPRIFTYAADYPEK